MNDNAVGAVLTALSGGPLDRADLIRALATQLTGDADSNAIVGMVVNDQFHRGKPWLYDGWRAALPKHKDEFRRLGQRDKVPWHRALIGCAGEAITILFRAAALTFLVYVFGTAFGCRMRWWW